MNLEDIVKMSDGLSDNKKPYATRLENEEISMLKENAEILAELNGKKKNEAVGVGVAIRTLNAILKGKEYV